MMVKCQRQWLHINRYTCIHQLVVNVSNLSIRKRWPELTPCRLHSFLSLIVNSVRNFSKMRFIFGSTLVLFLTIISTKAQQKCVIMPMKIEKKGNVLFVIILNYLLKWVIVRNAAILINWFLKTDFFLHLRLQRSSIASQ